MRHVSYFYPIHMLNTLTNSDIMGYRDQDIDQIRIVIWVSFVKHAPITVFNLRTFLADEVLLLPVTAPGIHLVCIAGMVKCHNATCAWEIKEMDNSKSLTTMTDITRILLPGYMLCLTLLLPGWLPFFFYCNWCQ